MYLLKKYEPIALLLLITAAIVLRVNVESTHYCTPDSDYYLEVSNNILSGKGFVGPKVFDFDTLNHRLIPLYHTTPFGHPEDYQQEFFAVWPLGYPSGITIVSWLTGLTPLWASKVLNLLLLALDFYLLTSLFGKRSSLPLFFLGSYSMLEIYSYTWSENLFIPFFLVFLIAIKKIQESEKFMLLPMLLLALSLTAMCLARYASVIYFLCAGLTMGWFFLKKDSTKTNSLFLGSSIGAILFGLYLFNNYLQSGHLTGMPRVDTQDFTYVELIHKFLIGIFNQLHIIKQFRISNSMDLVFYLITIIIQLSVMIYIGYLLILKSNKSQYSTFTTQIILYGILYLVFLTYMTFTSTIDPFDYRTLLPFYFPITIALLNELELRLKANNHLVAISIIKIFFFLSILLNLPKHYLIGLL